MRNNLAILALVVLATLSLTWAFNKPSIPYRQTSIPEQMSPNILPDFEATLLNGKEIRLYDFKGKVIILNLWASWCAPCLQEFPHLIKLARSMPDRIVLIAVSIDDNPRDITRFLDKVPALSLSKNVIIARDKDHYIQQKLFNTALLPETIIVAPDLTMARKIVGAEINWNSPELKRYFLGL